jgi:hypothetical protein
MLDRILPYFAFAMLLGFVGILVFTLGRIDIAVVAGITMALAGWDVIGPKKG